MPPMPTPTSRPSTGSSAPIVRLLCKWTGNPRNPTQDLADFQRGVEIRVKAMFITPDSRVKAKWGELRLAAGQDAVWVSKIGADSYSFPLDSTTIAPADKQHFKRTPRFDLTRADGGVQTVTVFIPDAPLVNVAFGASAA